MPKLPRWCVYEQVNDPTDLLAEHPGNGLFGWRCELCHEDTGPHFKDREIVKMLLAAHTAKRSHKWAARSPETRRFA